MAGLVAFGGQDVRDALLGLADVRPGGWATATQGLADDTGDASAVLVSVSGELADPSPDRGEALRALCTVAAERGVAALVLNASSLLGATEGSSTTTAEPLDRTIQRLNLAAAEASLADGLAVVDADRLAAELGGADNVLGPHTYSDRLSAALRDEVRRILVDLGVLADRGASVLAVPFLPQSPDLTFGRWLVEDGEAVEAGQPICDLTMTGLRRLHRPTSARSLGAIERERSPLRDLARRLAGTGNRQVTLTITLAARDAGTLRAPRVAPGDTVRVGEALAVVTRDADSPVPTDLTGLPGFRTAVDHA